MKIRMITFHTPINHGAVLQAYALQTHLKTQAEDVKIINYKTESLIKKYDYFKKWNSPRNIVGNIVKLKDYNKYKKKKKKFKEFSNTYFDLTSEVKNKEGLEEEATDVDFIFTGSDQVFNPTRKYQEEIDTFYLNFDVNKAKRVAYAPSFGVSNIPMDKKQMVSEYLKKFDYLSVRELNGKGIVKELINKNPLCVVDPVLLLTQEQWGKIEEKVKVPEKYLLCYALYECELEKQIVECLAKQLGLKVVLITPNIIPKIKYDKCYKDIGPKEFIYLLRNAEYVVTDSFHGAVFSTIFKKEFLVAIAKQQTKSRMTSYLHTIGLDERICEDLEQIPKNKINYKQVEERLEKQIKLSKEYINCCLTNGDVELLKNEEEKKIKTIEELKEKCTGCGTCALKCPTQAIKIIKTKEGFEEPVIDKEKCILCNKCVLECHVVNQNEEEKEEQAYYGRVKNEEVLNISSSGGIYHTLANQIIKQGGITYGAVLDKNKWSVKHLSSEESTIEEQMKSKYVQSSTYEAFTKIQKQIEQGKKILFCGTPCQVAGLKKLIGENENLITVDFICHGVPSPLVLKDKINEMEKRYKSKIKELFFRTKINSWSQQKLYAEFENGDIYFRDASNDDYLKLFYGNYTLRNSCYDCKYSSKKHIADITLADYWGVKKFSPNENDEKGLSLILINTKKGKELFEEIKSNIDVKPLELEKARYVYKTHDTYAKARRNVFFKEYVKNGYESAIKKVKEKQKLKIKIIACMKRYKYDKIIKNLKKSKK